jgi:hypothetical protein
MTLIDMLQLEDEPPRTFKRIIPFDGNSSMKLMHQVGASHIRDPHPFTDSDYLLPPEYVNQFADEVSSRKRSAAIEDDFEGDIIDTDEHDESVISNCTTNFKAAALDEKKKAWGCFSVNGIYVSACRHSFIMWFCDMIRSGEL